MMGYAFAAMLGWCGTIWPGWRPGPHPHPDPDPWWWIIRFIGAVGGIVAARYFGPMVGMDTGVVPMAVVSFFGGTFLGSVAEGLRGLTGGAKANVAS